MTPITARLKGFKYGTFDDEYSEKVMIIETEYSTWNGHTATIVKEDGSIDCVNVSFLKVNGPFMDAFKDSKDDPA